MAFPSAARAGTITLDTNFVGLQVHYEFQNVLAEPQFFGSVTMRDGTGLNPTLDGIQFQAYCADILTDVLDTTGGLQPGVGEPYAAEADLMSAWKDPNNLYSPTDGNLRAAYLYDRYADPSSPDAFAAGDLEGRSALQLAIWNVLYDDDFTVATTSGGAFHVSLLKYDPLNPGQVIPIVDLAQIASYEAIASRADGFLSTVDGLSHDALAGYDAAWLKLAVPGEGTPAQDFIGPATTVPEPGSLLLLGTGLAALTAFRRNSLRRG